MSIKTYNNNLFIGPNYNLEMKAQHLACGLDVKIKTTAICTTNYKNFAILLQHLYSKQQMKWNLDIENDKTILPKFNLMVCSVKYQFQYIFELNYIQISTPITNDVSVSVGQESSTQKQAVVKLANIITWTGSVNCKPSEIEISNKVSNGMFAN